ncbi:sulfate adenylyltransferase subunit CysN [Methylobacterium sp. V23]|uniref:sulfate adenylyltransferase subunit CysN n=1 Tax=Methylobacterium sp. V23 TaxID=2044878 RepID=UPI000CD9FECF|nr:sulfate adenylyltransferase subunit CysN [Methylobacterium sp. V23]POR39924.1 adenylyl-sulfate kinase [Methylobacterium sp. V23]
MGHLSDEATNKVDAYLADNEDKSLLRFITCGSVDDGKSTLIGRLLYDAHTILEDQLRTLTSDSQRVGTRDGALDFALLVDGLAAEREQGITIDVAYRYFSTEKRKFIVADTPGHEQYTRNMVTGATTADLAIILVDARKGILTQTRRHSYLTTLVGIKEIVLAVNKMDLVDFREDVFDDIVKNFTTFAEQIGLDRFVAIPISGTGGDNIISLSGSTPWFKGQPLLTHLETVEVAKKTTDDVPFRMPVQLVMRPHLNFRGFSGLAARGALRKGDAIAVHPSGRRSSIQQIIAAGVEVDQAIAGQSVTLTFTDELDCSRGDVVTTAKDPLEVADQFEATIVWMADQPLLPGRSYLLKIATKQVVATVVDIKHRVNINTMEHLAAKTLELNEIAVCQLSVSEMIPFEPYAVNRDLGGFILIDRLTNATLATGFLHFALRRSHNIHLQAVDVDKRTRAEVKRQKPALIWFTGLSGAGKSTISNQLERYLHGAGCHTYLLDGDNIRHGLNRDLGFTDADRVENIRRVAEVAKLMVDAGLIVLVSFIAPFRAEREFARRLVEVGEFFEVHVDAPLSVVEERDPKGLYKKARRGELKNFTGIDSPYEAPDEPEIYIDTTRLSVDEAVSKLVSNLKSKGVVHD